MFISEEELIRRIGSEKNIAQVDKKEEPLKVVPIPKREYTPTPPKETRTVAGILAGTGASVKSVANSFNMTPSQVRTAIKTPSAQSGIEKIRELAIDKLMLALGLMTEDKFENSSLKDLSYIAANVSRIIEKTSPRDAAASIQLLVYAPEIKSERMYKTLDV